MWQERESHENAGAGDRERDCEVLKGNEGDIDGQQREARMPRSPPAPASQCTAGQSRDRTHPEYRWHDAHHSEQKERIHAEVIGRSGRAQRQRNNRAQVRCEQSRRHKEIQTRRPGHDGDRQRAGGGSRSKREQSRRAHDENEQGPIRQRCREGGAGLERDPSHRSEDDEGQRDENGYS